MEEKFSKLDDAADGGTPDQGYYPENSEEENVENAGMGFGKISTPSRIIPPKKPEIPPPFSRGNQAE